MEDGGLSIIFCIFVTENISQNVSQNVSQKAPEISSIANALLESYISSQRKCQFPIFVLILPHGFCLWYTAISKI